MPEPPPASQSYDEAGVDRSQIRQMLALTPAERLQRLQEHVRAISRIRALNQVATECEER